MSLQIFWLQNSLPEFKSMLYPVLVFRSVSIGAAPPGNSIAQWHHLVPREIVCCLWLAICFKIQQKYSFNFNKRIHIQQIYSFNFNKRIHIQQIYSFNFNKRIHIQQKYSFNINKRIHIQQKNI